jgi:hypothetical protein
MRSKGKLMIYKIVVQRDDCEIDALYWNGSLEETINLAREIGINCEADQFRVIDVRLRLTCGYLNFRIARARRGLTVC